MHIVKKLFLNRAEAQLIVVKLGQTRTSACATTLNLTSLMSTSWSNSRQEPGRQVLKLVQTYSCSKLLTLACMIGPCLAQESRGEALNEVKRLLAAGQAGDSLSPAQLVLLDDNMHLRSAPEESAAYGPCLDPAAEIVLCSQWHQFCYCRYAVVQALGLPHPQTGCVAQEHAPGVLADGTEHCNSLCAAIRALQAGQPANDFHELELIDLKTWLIVELMRLLFEPGHICKLLLPACMVQPFSSTPLCMRCRMLHSNGMLYAAGLRACQTLPC